MKKSNTMMAVPLVIFIVFLWFLWKGLSNDPRILESVLINKPLPQFSIESLKDKNIIIEAMPKTSYLLNVWATWCPSCRAEHQYLGKLKQQGISIIGINYKDEREAAIAWLQQLGDPYQLVVYDEAGQLGIDLGVYGAPETYLVDALGKIRYRHAGPMDETVWQSQFLPRINRLGKLGGKQ